MVGRIGRMSCRTLGRSDTRNNFSFVATSPMSRRNQKTNTEPKKRGRRSWTTEEQDDFLNSKIPSYLAAQSSHPRSDFWPSFYEKWFEQWPTEPLSEKEIEEGLTEGAKLAKAKLVSTSIYYLRTWAYHRFSG